MAETINVSQMAPVNGLKMMGETGSDGSGPQTFGWITIPNALTTTFQFLLVGTFAAHMTLKIQGCVVGGEASPEDLVTVDASGATVTDTQANKSYDKFRVVVTAQTAAGTGSQVRVSSRA